VWNRALGKTSIFSVEINKWNQASHNDVATPLIDNTQLLGLQAINSSSNRDSNVNRPRLQTSWRRANDVFGDNSYDTNRIVPDDNSISGPRARTGHF
jgi:hypothetical protein